MKKPGPGMEKTRIRDGKNPDPGWKKSDPGLKKIRIRDRKKFGSGTNIPDHIRVNSVLQIQICVPHPWIRDPGWKNPDPG
jgi:hypothetical protein